MKKWNQKQAIAFHFGVDVSDIDWYQDRGEKEKVFAGASSYYCAKPKAGKLPSGYNWTERSDNILNKQGWQIFQSDGEII